MKKLWLVVLTLGLAAAGSTTPSFAASPHSSRKPVRVFVQGDSSRLPDFVNECKHEFAERGMEFTLVRSDAEYDYNIVIAQESSIGGAASTVIALDRKGLFVASVVRSGRWTGKGALNASAKELAKKLAVLGGIQ